MQTYGGGNNNKKHCLNCQVVLEHPQVILQIFTLLVTERHLTQMPQPNC